VQYEVQEEKLSMTSSVDLLEIDQLFSHEQFNKVINPVLPQLGKMSKFYVYFNFSFLILIAVEVFLLFSLLTFLVQSFLVAFSLAVIFFTFFTYFTLRLYFQTKKPVQLREIKDEYLNACKILFAYQEGVPEHHVALAKACYKLANLIHGKEYAFYRPPTWLEILAPAFERFSCWWHWEDFHEMREFLLKAAVVEHIKLVKSEPTSLEAHAALANAYVMLSGLYIDPRRTDEYDEDRWVPGMKYSRISEEKFRSTAERAIEEFKILCEYAPDDPWVHSQLAYSYHDLQMPQEEIKEYEILCRLNPQDKDNLFKLGILYFQQGLNAKGLKVYEDLKRSHYKNAESLIKYYGTHDV
jgi:hypothetical protein